MFRFNSLLRIARTPRTFAPPTQFRLLSSLPPSGPDTTTTAAADANNTVPNTLPDATLLNDTSTAEATAQILTDPQASPAFWPLTDNAIYMVQNVHEVGGLPWFAAIAGTTLLMRSLLLPLAVKSMKNAAKLAKVQPEMAKIQERMKNARGDEEKQAYANEMRGFMSKHGVNPIATFVPILAQMPIFMSFFFGLQRMATDYPTLVDGGTLWFTDLTVADPTYGLPLLASASFLITIELGGEAGQQQSNPEQAKTMKNVMRAMAVGMVPLTMSMPASVFMYWITSNTFSCVQTAAFKIPAIKNALGIPIAPLVAPTPSAGVPAASPMGVGGGTASNLTNFSTNMQNIQPPPPTAITDAHVVSTSSQDSGVTTQGRKKRKARQKKRRRKR